MRLIYYKVPGGNFGDDLNEWLWDELIPGWRQWSDATSLVGVGTILMQGFLPEGQRKLVLGAGTGYGIPPVIADRPQEWDIRAVRGPHTASALNLPLGTGIVDPTVLIADLPEFTPTDRSDETVFVPHHSSDFIFDWNQICAGTSITPISPTEDSRDVIRRIANARSVIAESMHAAIIADAFRIPWQPVAIHGEFNHFKWKDWGDSLEVDVTAPMFYSNLQEVRDQQASRSMESGDSPSLKPELRQTVARAKLERAAGRPFRLSRPETLDSRKRALYSVLEDVKRDYG